MIDLAYYRKKNKEWYYRNKEKRLQKIKEYQKTSPVYIAYVKSDKVKENNKNNTLSRYYRNTDILNAKAKFKRRLKKYGDWYQKIKYDITKGISTLLLPSEDRLRFWDMLEIKLTANKTIRRKYDRIQTEENTEDEAISLF